MTCRLEFGVDKFSLPTASTDHCSSTWTIFFWQWYWFWINSSKMNCFCGYSLTSLFSLFSLFSLSPGCCLKLTFITHHFLRKSNQERKLVPFFFDLLVSNTNFILFEIIWSEKVRHEEMDQPSSVGQWSLKVHGAASCGSPLLPTPRSN